LQSRWHKLRTLVQFTPFVQTYRNRHYEWVQLAGHAGNFRAGADQGTILKKLCTQEELCYRQFAADAIADYVPRYFGTQEVQVADKDETESKLTAIDISRRFSQCFPPSEFIQLQDCLSTFTAPSIMDCKIGVRTYLEMELAKAQEKPKLRKDMYDKMVAVDPTAPTQEEHQQQGVTKPRY
jgi:1D-myo-inositol-triphosphate 3-kinase